MINLIDILILVWLHFFADFVLQSDYVARNKSSNNKILALHCLIYSIPFLWLGWVFALFNGLCHFITDYITSRVSSKLYKSGEIHWFFVVIGFDQAVHLTTITTTAILFNVVMT